MCAAFRTRTHFACSVCDATFPKWAGRCPACGEWNTLVEEADPAAAPGRGTSAHGLRVVPDAEPLAASPDPGSLHRPTGIGEVDRVLGGGIVPGALVLLGGDPGIGKSTLALQLAQRAGRAGAPALYCAGEESPAQLSLRAQRLGCDGDAVAVLAETDLDAIVTALDRDRPPLAVVDSVQTLVDASVAGGAGSVSQVREAAARLLPAAKRSGVPVVLVGHVTKDGAIAGPRTLEHMVDVVLYLEGERHGDNRLLRGIKNRFGASGELGIFSMTDGGLVPLPAPGRAFLDEASLGLPGSVLTVTCEGSRPLAVEVQALTVRAPSGLPRRNASGLDIGRLHVLLAVLERRARLPLAQCDVYLNAVGGVRLAEPAVDLAVALAVAGAQRDLSLPGGWVATGELGLGGEVRRVARLDRRLAEAAALGFTDAVVPLAQAGDHLAVAGGMKVHGVSRIAEAIALLG